MTSNNTKKCTNVRLPICSLIFFVCSFAFSCKRNTTNEIEVVWENKNAVAISIPKAALGGTLGNSIDRRLKVYVDKNKATAMLGEYDIDEDIVVFKPLVPLSRGLTYTLYFDDKLVGNIAVPSANTTDAPRLLMVYPTADTLPENLLKMYLQFSAPMREGEWKKYIALINQNNDTLPDVFLDLQPELWNKERTALTIWLDPGRIKRDLIPNQQLGNPLQKGKTYKLVVSNGWKDVQGLQLQQLYSKQFEVKERDSITPAIEQWKLSLPAAQTKAPLKMTFNEPLDYFLLQETITIVDEENKSVVGSIQVGDKEQMLQFIPINTWVAGNYTLRVNAVLEDLAGNNLTRPFDRDLQVKFVNEGRTKFEIGFQIK